MASNQDKTSNWLHQKEKETGGYQEIYSNFKTVDNNGPTLRGMRTADNSKAPALQGTNKVVRRTP